MRRYRIRRRFTRRYGRTRPVRRYRKTFRKKVRRVILQNAELKQAVTNLNEDVAIDYQRWDLGPAIAQGPGDNQRIGNNIMSKNFQVKCFFRPFDVQNPIGDVNQVGYCRVYIVWPRTFSRPQAISNLNSTNFPLFGMMDQDNWIVWYDRAFSLTSHPERFPTTPLLYRMNFNKKFFCKLEFPTSSETLANKTPWMIIVHNFANTTFRLTVRGYIKMSYKDV